MKFQPDREWDEHIERKQKQRMAGSKGDLLWKERKRRNDERNINHREPGEKSRNDVHPSGNGEHEV